MSVPQGSRLNSRTLKFGVYLSCVLQVESKKTDQNKTVPQVVQQQTHMSHHIKCRSFH